MAAVLVKSGRIIDFGINKMSPGVVKDPRYVHKALHAELALALKVEPETLRGATIYVAGYSRCGNVIKSKPCPLCEETLRQFGVKMVVYTEKSGEVVQYNIA